MDVLLFGANGQVGTETRRRAAASGARVIPLGRSECDLAAPGAARAAIEAAECAAVINAAAYTAVDKAESEPEIAARINAGAPGEMAKACAERGLPFIHLSTDYVFSGEGARPYRESDPTAPLGAYGRSKREGEEAVLAAGGAAAVIRLSWVFSAHGSNFVKTMLRLGRERPLLRVVADQRGKPTPAAGAADAALLAARALIEDRAPAGLYHFAGDEETTWAGFAEAIMEAAGFDTPVEPIGTKDFPTPARRPAYSVLDTDKFARIFGVKAPSWREALKEVVREIESAEAGAAT